MFRRTGIKLNSTVTDSLRGRACLLTNNLSLCLGRLTRDTDLMVVPQLDGHLPLACQPGIDDPNSTATRLETPRIDSTPAPSSPHGVPELQRQCA